MTEKDLTLETAGVEAWLGRDESDFRALLQKEAEGMALEINAEELQTLLFGGQDPSESEFRGYDNMVQNLGNGIAVISINGSMTDKETIWSRVFNIPSYQGIANALVATAMHDDIRGTILDWDSTGGKAKGHMQLVDTIKMLTSKGFPVYSYASGDMMSAAIWTGTTADKVFASKDAMLGSIGVIAVHTDRTEAFKQMGIKHSVFRAGENKAPVTPFEPLDKKAEAYIQTQITTMHGKFIEGVAENIGQTPAYVRANLADGSEFEAQKAADLKLIDGVKTFDQTVNALLKRIERGKQRQAPGNYITGANAMPKDENISPDAQVAALVASTGVSPEEATKALIAKGIISAPGDEEAGGKPGETETDAGAGGDGTGTGTDTSADTGGKPDGDEGGDSADGNGAPDGAPQAVGESVVLAKMVSDLQAKVTELTVESTKLKADLEGAQAASAGYRKAMIEAIRELRIGLGRPGSVVDLETAADTTVLAAYMTTKAEIVAVMPGGQTSHTKSGDNDPNDKVVASAHADTLRRVTTFSRTGE